MIQINIKSPDRVNVLLLLDELTAGRVQEKSTGPSEYSIWCVGVEMEALRARLKKTCTHDFELSVYDSPPGAGGSM